MEYLVEVRPTVRRSGPLKLVPLKDIDNYTGFRSVFAYDPAVAEQIRAAGSTGFLRGVQVYSDTLFLDFDNCSPEETLAYLRSVGVGYEHYGSGNRSSHIHIPLEPMYGAWVPRSQKAWIKKHAPRSDISYLHPAGMYRLARTYHEKNPGHCKALLERVPGDLLNISAVEDTFYSRVHQTGEVRTEDFVQLITTKVFEGDRRPKAWLISTVGAELGLDFDETLKNLTFWNDNFVFPPHDITTLERQCRSAYERLGRKYG